MVRPVSSHAARVLRLLVALAMVAALVPMHATTATAQEAEHEKTDEIVVGAEDTDIAVSIFRPAGASAQSPAPVILHSHGWGGSRNSGDGAFRRELDRGFGVVSIDQRGFGQSGGQANVQDPELEGRDIIAVIDRVAELDWVLHDVDESGDLDPTDPVLFAMGGSYGGGFQLVAALTEIRDTADYDDDGRVLAPGRTRFNALAPDMTWFDLTRSLAPEGVVRTAWAVLLYTAGIPTLPQHVHEGFVYGATTGQWPDGTVPGIANLEERFFQNGPSGFVVDGHQLDVPTLITQGFSDNLFNGNEGWHNFERTLTPEAREQSLFLGYNGGHALPNVLPAGAAGSGNACEDDVSGLRLDFFEAAMDATRNPADLKPATYSVSTLGDTCVHLDALDDTTTVEAGDLSVGGRTVTTTGLGLPQHRELITGPAVVAGVPHLRADVTSVGVEQRVFFALSVGTSPLDARVVQNNMMPLREQLPVVGEPRTVELPALAIELEEGESLFLTASPMSDMSFGHGSIRTPGVVMLEDVVVDVPLVTDDATEPGDPGDDPDEPTEPCRPGNRSDRAADRGRDCPPGQSRG
jgi:ABC-2 type transport system ATP-binding protein